MSLPVSDSDDLTTEQQRPAKKPRWDDSCYTGSQDLFDSSSSELTYNDMDLNIDEDVDGTPYWTGVPLASLTTVPGDGVRDQYPSVTPSHSHTVCVNLPLPTQGCPTPNPARLRDVWDDKHVRMPWSKENLYPVENDNGQKVVSSRWDLITRSLTRQRIGTSRDLEFAILEYNTRYRDKPDWSFQGLHHFFAEVLSPEETESFFSQILPSMVSLLVTSPQILTRPLPLLVRGTAASITLSQQQVGVLLLNSFFCTFPRRNVRGKGNEYSSYPDINFNRLFGLSTRRPEAQAEKLKCLFNYFRRLVTDTSTGLVTFTRSHVPRTCSPQWRRSEATLPRLYISSRGTIEDDGLGMLQVDFANAMVGGGVLGQGLVQEEIRFTISPELIVSRLFTQRLEDNESMIITGAERFSDYSGYADSFQFTGNHNDMTLRDGSGRRNTSIVAMDALHFSRREDQYSRPKVDRELRKAFAGFQNRHVADGRGLVAVATGNWGCGAFGGDPRLKALLQLMVAGEVKRDVAYFTFGDDKLRQDVFDLYTFLVENNVTVGRIYQAIGSYCGTVGASSDCDLYDYLYQVLGADLPNADYDATTDDSSNGSRESNGLSRREGDGDESKDVSGSPGGLDSNKSCVLESGSQPYNRQDPIGRDQIDEPFHVSCAPSNSRSVSNNAKLGGGGGLLEALNSLEESPVAPLSSKLKETGLEKSNCTESILTSASVEIIDEANVKDCNGAKSNEKSSKKAQTKMTDFFRK